MELGDDLKGADQEAFSTLIDEIQCIKEAHPEFNDERILEIIDQNRRGNGRYNL